MPGIEVRRYVGFHPLKTIVEKPVGGINSEENLEKDSPYVLLVFPGDEGLHSISPQVVVELVHVQESLVRFPGIAGFAEASPADFELHGRSFVAIAAVADDRLNNGDVRSGS